LENKKIEIKNKQSYDLSRSRVVEISFGGKSDDITHDSAQCRRNVIQRTL